MLLMRRIRLLRRDAPVFLGFLQHAFRILFPGPPSLQFGSELFPAGRGARILSLQSFQFGFELFPIHPAGQGARGLVVKLLDGLSRPTAGRFRGGIRTRHGAQRSSQRVTQRVQRSSHHAQRSSHHALRGVHRSSHTLRHGVHLLRRSFHGITDRGSHLAQKLPLRSASPSLEAGFMRRPPRSLSRHKALAFTFTQALASS